jgi:hypothetical protein
MLKQLLRREYWASRRFSQGTDDIMKAIAMEKSSQARRKAERLSLREARPSFIALDRFRSKKAGLLVTVELDRDTDDFGHLIGKRIVVDGKMEMCFSVERLPHAPPCKKGESVSLLIRKGA